MTEHDPSHEGGRTSEALPTSAVHRRILALGGVLVGVVAVLGAVVGAVSSGVPGAVSGLIGAALALVLVSASSLAVLFSNRYFGRPDFPAVFLGSVFGGWVLKFAVFIGVLAVLRNQSWIDRPVLFGAVVVAVLGALIIDIVTVRRARIPIVAGPPAAR